MQNIGRYRINTVPSITRKESSTHQRILASILKESCDAIDNNDEDRKIVYSRLIWLLPPLLLRKPKGSVVKRMDAFMAGDLEFCIKGMLATRDNYYTVQKSPSSIWKSTADKIFNGQYAKAMSILTQEQVIASITEIRDAMLAKHPPRSEQDDIKIKKLVPSISIPDVSEEQVYLTAMRPPKRGVAPGPNGNRAEFLQSAFYNPLESSSTATTIHYMTKHINMERQGRLSDEWYEFASFSNLIAITKKLRPIGMGYSGRKLVSGVSLMAAAKEIRQKFASFQLSSLVRNGSESVVHLIRHLHKIHGDFHVFFQIDVKNAFNSVSRLHGLLAIAQHLPQLYTFILRTYRNMNKLWVNASDDQIRDFILSQEGSTQGTVDGGIFFNNAINRP